MSDKIIKVEEEALEIIKNSINEVLIKRGFPIVKVKENDRSKYPRLEVKSETFNTTPVIFKSITIDNFGGLIKESDTIIKVGGEEIRVDTIEVFIPVHVSYENFGGGGNGCSLFTYKSTIFKDNGKISVNRVSII